MSSARSQYLTPRGLLTGQAARGALDADAAWPLLGGRAAFTAVEITERHGERFEAHIVTRGSRALAMETGLAPFLTERPPFCGLPLDKPVVMGVLNVTPDSFSDGGRFIDPGIAVAHGLALAEAGAAIIDVGGESTRPGAASVPESEEIARTVPVIKALVAQGVRVSIDSRNAPVAAAALNAGATIVNDITALSDARVLSTVVAAKASIVLMHMQGEPSTMQAAPRYAWAPGDIYDFLAERVERCVAAGISRSRIAVDPGIGFGKTAAHNAAILDHIGLFHGLGCAVVLGASRKAFIGRMSRGEGPDARLAGSLACAQQAAGQGVQILRVHDVAETRQMLAVLAAIGETGLDAPVSREGNAASKASMHGA